MLRLLTTLLVVAITAWIGAVAPGLTGIWRYSAMPEAEPNTEAA